MHSVAARAGEQYKLVASDGSGMSWVSQRRATHPGNTLRDHCTSMDALVLSMDLMIRMKAYDSVRFVAAEVKRRTRFVEVKA